MVEYARLGEALHYTIIVSGRARTSGTTVVDSLQRFYDVILGYFEGYLTSYLG